VLDFFNVCFFVLIVIPCGVVKGKDIFRDSDVNIRFETNSYIESIVSLVYDEFWRPAQIGLCMLGLTDHASLCVWGVFDVDDIISQERCEVVSQAKQKQTNMENDSTHISFYEACMQRVAVTR